VSAAVAGAALIVIVGLLSLQGAAAAKPSPSPLIAPAPSPSPFAPSSTSGAWTQLQGGATHQADAPTGVQPPFRQAWSFQEPGSNQGLSNPVVFGDTVYAVGLKAVYGLSIESGTQVWSTPRVKGPLTSPAVGTDGSHVIVVFTQGEGQHTQLVGAMVGGSGASKKESTAPPPAPWTAQLKAQVTGGVTIDGTTALVGDNAGNLYAFDISTGKQLWIASLGSGLIESPVAVSDGTAYAVLRDRNGNVVSVIAVSEATGQKSWTFAPRATAGALSTLTVAGGYLYTAAYDRQVRAISTSSHTQTWSSLLRNLVLPIGGLAYADGDIYVADVAGGLYEIDAKTGKQIWDFQFSTGAKGTTAIIRGMPAVSGGYVLVGLQDGRFAAVRRSDGTLAWIDSTGKGAIKPFAVTDTMLLAAKGGKDGGIYAFTHSSGSLTAIVSPTKLRAKAFEDMALGALVVFAVVALLMRLLGSTMWSVGSKYEKADEGSVELEEE
jgi:outer membrane protein assembly factor BamB